MENFINYQKIKWSKTILLCFGILFLYNFIDNFIWEYAETTMSKEAFEKTSYYFFDTIVCILCFFLFFFFYWSFRKELKKNKRKEFHTFWMLVQSVIIMLGISGLTSLWLDFSYSKLSHIPFVANSIKSYDNSWSGIEKEPYFYVFLAVVFLGPIVEELMFRGIIFRLLEQHNVYIAFILSSFLFGLWHMEFIQSVYTIFLGLATAIIYFRTQSMFYPILIHILNNFLSTLPPNLENEIFYEWLDKIEIFMIFPSLFLLFFMIKTSRKKIFS